MHFFYTAHYDLKDRKTKLPRLQKRPASETSPDPSELYTNIQMFFLADMLLSDRLKSFTTSQIEKCFANPAPADLDAVLALVYDGRDPTGLPFFQPLIKFCSQNLDALCGEFGGEGIMNLQPDFFLRVLRCGNASQKEIRKERDELRQEAADKEEKVVRLKQELSNENARWLETERLCRENLRCPECGDGELELDVARDNVYLPRIKCNRCSFECWS